jgi:hypothetical protein
MKRLILLTLLSGCNLIEHPDFVTDYNTWVYTNGVSVSAEKINEKQVELLECLTTSLQFTRFSVLDSFSAMTINFKEPSMENCGGTTCFGETDGVDIYIDYVDNWNQVPLKHMMIHAIYSYTQGGSDFDHEQKNAWACQR